MLFDDELSDCLTRLGLDSASSLEWHLFLPRGMYSRGSGPLLGRRVKSDSSLWAAEIQNDNGNYHFYHLKAEKCYYMIYLLICWFYKEVSWNWVQTGTTTSTINQGFLGGFTEEKIQSVWASVPAFSSGGAESSTPLTNAQASLSDANFLKEADGNLSTWILHSSLK